MTSRKRTNRRRLERQAEKRDRQIRAGTYEPTEEDLNEVFKLDRSDGASLDEVMTRMLQTPSSALANAPLVEDEESVKGVRRND